MSRPGVLPEAEPMNEVIVSALFDLPISTVLTTLNGIFIGSSEPESKEGVLASFLQDAQPIPETLPRFDVDSFQRLAIVDLMTLNADRNRTNALVRDGRLYGIDQATVAPAAFEAPGIFFWRTSEQAFIRFSPENILFIQTKNFEEDRARILGCFPDYPRENLATLRDCYALVQHAVSRNLPPFAIASLLVQKNDATVSVMKALYNQVKNLPEETAFSELMARVDRALDHLATLDWDAFEGEAANP